jgi:plastocyanin
MRCATALRFLSRLSITAAAVAFAGCSSSSSPTSPGSTGGHSSTINASGTASGSTFFFNPTPDTVAVGTTATYTFADVAHVVHFDVAGAPTDIPATMNTSVARTFPTAGTYPYHCTIHPYMHGTVVVQ